MIGDSKLIINFMNRSYKPGKKIYVDMTALARGLCRKIAGQVRFYHVKRVNNTWADFLSQIALLN